jgi:hypothetical protein
MRVQKRKHNNTIKLLFVGVAIFVVMMLFMVCSAKGNHYYSKANHISIVNSYDLTIEELQSRNGKLIIEKVIGQVDNFVTGAGHQLDNPDYYISYKGVDGISNGNIICTYFIYNPENNYEDDIVYRYDYIIDAQIVDVPPTN